MIEAPYPDIEAALVELITAHFGVSTRRVGITRPADVAARARDGWYLRVYVTGPGAEYERTTDVNTVAVDVYSQDRNTAMNTAREARALITAGRHRVSGVVVDHGRKADGPFEIEDTDTTLRIVTATYAVSARRPT